MLPPVTVQRLSAQGTVALAEEPILGRHAILGYPWHPFAVSTLGCKAWATVPQEPPKTPAGKAATKAAAVEEDDSEEEDSEEESDEEEEVATLLQLALRGCRLTSCQSICCAVHVLGNPCS